MNRLLLSVASLWMQIPPVVSSQNCFLSRHLESTKGLLMIGHEMVAFPKVSLVQCARACFLTHHPTCRSFSYSRTARFCQLNRRHQRDVPNDFQMRPDFAFYQAKWFSTKFFDGYEGSHCLDQGPCGKSSINSMGKHCYQVRVDNNRTYVDAGPMCRQRFGHLAMFEDSGDRKAVKAAMRKAGQFGQFWMGADDMDRDDVWRWVDGSRVGMSQPPWKYGQPDNYPYGIGGEERCGAVEHSPGSPGDFLFNDVPCPLVWPYICQYEPWIYQNW